MKFVSLFAGCGSVPFALASVGHELDLLAESDLHSRQNLRSRFQNVELQIEESVSFLRDDVRLLTASLQSQTGPSSLASAPGEPICPGRGVMRVSSRSEFSTEHPGFLTTRGLRSRLAHVVRLARKRPVPWILLDCNVSALEGQEAAAPDIAVIYQELERLGYSVAHRSVDLRGWGVPCMTSRVLVLASVDGDPRDVLLAEQGTTSLSPTGSNCGGVCSQVCKTQCYCCQHEESKTQSPSSSQCRGENSIPPVAFGIDLLKKTCYDGLVPPLSCTGAKHNPICLLSFQDGKALGEYLEPNHAEILYGLPEGWTWTCMQACAALCSMVCPFFHSRRFEQRFHILLQDPVKVMAKPESFSPAMKIKFRAVRLDMLSRCTPVQFIQWIGRNLMALYKTHKFIPDGELETPMVSGKEWPCAGFSIGKERIAARRGEFPVLCGYSVLSKAFRFSNSPSPALKADVSKWMLTNTERSKQLPRQLLSAFDVKRRKEQSMPPPLNAGDSCFVLLEATHDLWPALLLDPESDDIAYIPAEQAKELPSDAKAILLLGQPPCESTWTTSSQVQSLPYAPYRQLAAAALRQMHTPPSTGSGITSHRADLPTPLGAALQDADARYRAQNALSTDLPLVSVLIDSWSVAVEDRGKLLRSLRRPCTLKNVPAVMPERFLMGLHSMAGDWMGSRSSLISALVPCQRCQLCRLQNSASASTTGATVTNSSLLGMCMMMRAEAAALQHGHQGAKITLMRDGALGSKVSVYWPLEGSWFQGVLQAFDHETTQFRIKYDDGDVEETWLWAR